MDLQKYLDNKFKAVRQEEFQNSEQLSLGELIDIFEGLSEKYKDTKEDDIPDVCFDFEYLYPTSIDSWRGIYAELALNFETEWTSEKKALKVSEFLELLKSADGKTFEGYKGGEYVMDRSTPVWVANYGSSGNTAVVGILDTTYRIIIKTEYIHN